MKSGLDAMPLFLLDDLLKQTSNELVQVTYAPELIFLKKQKKKLKKEAL